MPNMCSTPMAAAWTEQGKATIFALDASEKLYADYQLTVTNPGGHSSLPDRITPSTSSPMALERSRTTPFPSS